LFGKKEHYPIYQFVGRSHVCCLLKIIASKEKMITEALREQEIEDFVEMLLKQHGRFPM